MAIIIPSNKIYSKSFDPIVDNYIDKIECTITTTTFDRKYSTLVYSNNNILPTVNRIDPYTNSKNGSISEQILTGDQKYNEIDTVLTGYIKKYKFIIYIPKSNLNKYISNISRTFAEQDEYGNYVGNAINYTISYVKKVFSTNGQFKIPVEMSWINDAYKQPNPKNGELLTNTLTFSNEQQVGGLYSGHIINGISLLTDTTKITDGIKFTHDVELLDIENQIYKSGATVEIKGNIGDSVSVSENSEEYIVELELLGGIGSYWLDYTYSENGIWYNNHNGGNVEEVIRDLNGDGQELVPHALELSIYGDTISLDIGDFVQEIGNGTNVLSISKNELIQSGSEPTPTTQFMKILPAYKNGKQTATISCPIANYYDVLNPQQQAYTNQTIITQTIQIDGAGTYPKDINGQPTTRVVSISKGKLKSVSVKSPTTLGIQILIYNITDNKFEYQVKVSNLYPNVDKLIAITIEFEASIEYEADKPVIDTSVSGKMLFKHGDIVIPYVYTNKGDEPLSYNTDLSPKQFKVVGTKISKKQGGTQELTLVEV